MKKYLYDFAVIGGDMRQIYLAEILSHNGYRVITYQIDAGETYQIFDQANTLQDAVKNAKSVLGPIPFIQKNSIKHAGDADDMTLENLGSLLEMDQKIYGGCIPQELIRDCIQRNAEYYDYMKNEEIAIFNSIATAEGVLAEAIMSYPGNLQGSSAAILGFGKCARTLADKLKGLSARVTVVARKPSQREWARTYGYKALDFEEVSRKWSKYDLIFNTIPNVIIHRAELEKMRKDTMILDIASAPGGVDFKAAEELGISAEIYPSLPGKYAPRASAAALAEYVVQTNIK